MQVRRILGEGHSPSIQQSGSVGSENPHHPGPAVPIVRHAGQTDDCGTYIPEDEIQPPVLVVGSLAAEARLTRLALRHGLEPRALILLAREG